ncbi:diguanylate cyclase [Shewanella marisflavi]|uniref:GGDEF domain-containing protein n=1 Tax=Shewanella marisflavi TaxID=260364 RepID=UPI0020104B64|nr:GGDEF domain-containing protein [Shewanella marisflavi]MCL1041141.1 diguanylate cyclase [Shewanella marisflavi]
MPHDVPNLNPDLLQWLANDSYLLQLTLDTLPVPIFYKDIEGVYLGCNSAFESFIKLTREELIGKSVYELFDADLADVYQRADQALFDKPGVQIYEKEIKTREGDAVYVRFHKTSFNDNQGKVAGLIGVIFDITEQKALEAQLTHHAIYDDLTQFYNRREGIAIGERLHHACSQQQGELGIILIDIDFFKQINDTYGHMTGDEALRHIATILKQQQDPQDVLMRWGGEEFVVLVNRPCGAEQSFETYLYNHAQAYCDAIRQNRFQVGDDVLEITFSCGLSIFTPGKHLNQMLHDADTALYRAKDAGRDNVSW